MGLAPQIVVEIFEIVRELNQKDGVSVLLAEQNTNVALKYDDYGYILESGRIMIDGPPRRSPRTRTSGNSTSACRARAGRVSAT